jgi:hypothetical protein
VINKVECLQICIEECSVSVCNLAGVGGHVTEGRYKYRQWGRRKSLFPNSIRSKHTALCFPPFLEMPETSSLYINGFSSSNGHMAPELPEGETFLFTSESVGEGHPG